jgi:predicted S18 family serine protease
LIVDPLHKTWRDERFFWSARRDTAPNPELKPELWQVSALARERAHALEEKGNVIDRLQKANREMETSQLASSDELAAGRIEVAKAREEASRLSHEAQAAARQAAEAQANAKAVESELALAKQEVIIDFIHLENLP